MLTVPFGPRVEKMRRGPHCLVSLTGCGGLVGERAQSGADPQLVPNATEASGRKTTDSRVSVFLFCLLKGIASDVGC